MVDRLPFQSYSKPQDFISETETRVGKSLTLNGVLGNNDLCFIPVTRFLKGEMSYAELQEAQKFEEETVLILFNQSTEKQRKEFIDNLDQGTNDVLQSLRSHWQNTIDKHAVIWKK